MRGDPLREPEVVAAGSARWGGWSKERWGGYARGSRSTCIGSVASFDALDIPG
jgi:hypothetical protein